MQNNTLLGIIPEWIRIPVTFKINLCWEQMKTASAFITQKSF